MRGAVQRGGCIGVVGCRYGLKNRNVLIKLSHFSHLRI